MSAKTLIPISMNEPLLVDTSAWFALANRKEKHHEMADRLLTNGEHVCVTTDFIIDETVTLTRMKLGHAAAAKIGKMLLAGETARVIHITPELQREAMRLFEKYDDKRFSFTDCTSFAVMERFAIQQAFSFDGDFKRAGFISLP